MREGKPTHVSYLDFILTNAYHAPKPPQIIVYLICRSLFVLWNFVWIQAIVPGEVPVRNLGKPSRVNPNFQKGNETGTIACLWHAS
jgi:hypothetical protein